MGGAVFAWYEDSILLTESQFLSNQSGSGGGGLAVQDAVSLALYGVRLTENEAGWGGGGLYLYNTGAEVPLVDTVFSGNRSAGSGGAPPEPALRFPLKTVSTSGTSAPVL